MSVQFGRWNCDGKPVGLQELDRIRPMLAPYGSDAEGTFCQRNVGILYRAFHTTKESCREQQPYVLPSRAILTWDGRLDSREELIHRLSHRLLSVDSADGSIASAAYEEWGTGCFAKLIGDWAISIWNPSERSLILAKDPIGTRHLYYSTDEEQVVWSSILDPLVLFTGRSFALNEEYIAGWFSFFPAAHLTPYAGIHSVPPSCFVRLEKGRQTVRKYWDFDPGYRIRYHTDKEYEEHFRTVFLKSVRRRLRSNAPILAELSGGMDSSSIVCLADTIIARGGAEAPRLDTVSYYNDSEPNWNERPYFSKVEEQRGRTGCHIDVGAQDSFKFEFERDTFLATPGSGGGGPTEAKRQFAACLASQDIRVVLSGIGGDEVTGGVPTPTSELMNLLARGRFQALAQQLKVWALNKRKPWFHLFFEAVREFFPPALVGVPKYMQPADWLQPSFVKRHRAALTGYPSRVKFPGPLPSFQDNVSTLNGLRRQLACLALPSEPPYEKRYPYLDRDLLEFVYAVPREQLVRPGQRRSLMRRALVGIVPDELLNRKRKAFVVRSPTAAICTEWASPIEMSQQMICPSLGIVDAKAFCEAVERARHGQEVRIVLMMRTLGIESWLRTIRDRGIFMARPSTIVHGSTRLSEQRMPHRRILDKNSAS
jgi:asparagine synthase (glutamine-hydrolysing)